MYTFFGACFIYKEVVALHFNYLEEVELEPNRNFTIEMGRERERAYEIDKRIQGHMHANGESWVRLWNKNALLLAGAV